MKNIVTCWFALIMVCGSFVATYDARAAGPWEYVDSYHLTVRFRSSPAPHGITDPNSYTNDMSVGFFLYQVQDYDEVLGYTTRTVAITNPPTSVDIILGCNENVYMWAQYPNFFACLETNSWPAFTLEFYGNLTYDGLFFSVTNTTMTPSPTDVGFLWVGSVYPTSGGNIIEDLVSIWGPPAPSPVFPWFNVWDWLENNDPSNPPRGNPGNGNQTPVPWNPVIRKMLNGSQGVGSMGHSYATTELLASDSLDQPFVSVATNTSDLSGFSGYDIPTNSVSTRFYKIRQVGVQSGSITNSQ